MAVEDAPSARPGVVDEWELADRSFRLRSDPYPGQVSLRLFDTATRSQRDFVPLRTGAASIYVCGATVQGLPHIGHVRSGLNYDVLRRWLDPPGLRRPAGAQRHRHRRQDPRQGRGRAGRPWWEWAATYERAFQAAYDALGCLPAVDRAAGHRARAADGRADASG